MLSLGPVFGKGTPVDGSGDFDGEGEGEADLLGVGEDEG
jgi:hypothetical protein